MAAGDADRLPPAAVVQSLLDHFCALTSATQQEAAFFLGSNNWIHESAVRSFYDPAGEEAESDDKDYVGACDDDEDYMEENDEDAALAAAAAAAEERRSPSKRLKKSHDARGGSGSRPSGASGRRNVRTLSDLGGGKREAGSDEDSDDDDESAPPPEFYNGGEKRMVVRDRSKRKNNADVVFKQGNQRPFEPHKRQRNFAGTGRLLTGETVQPNAAQPLEDIVHSICFWSNGFTVNDGPLRSFDDPENASFLESIKNSECPTELEPADDKSTVNVNLVRKEEECPEPDKRGTPFQGGRRTLGTTPSDTTSIGPASSTATATNDVFGWVIWTGWKMAAHVLKVFV